jgi:hypothetical protein
VLVKRSREELGDDDLVISLVDLAEFANVDSAALSRCVSILGMQVFARARALTLSLSLCACACVCVCVFY